MKKCRVCSLELNKDTTTWYRQKNYIYLCNVCNRKEKKEQARKTREKYPELTNKRSREYLANLKENDTKKYTAIQQRASAKKRADALGLDFNLTTEYILSIYVEVCPVLRKELKYGGGERSPYSPALDRIDPTKGYVQGNVQILSCKANMMKSNASEEELLAFAEWVLRSNKVNADC